MSGSDQEGVELRRRVHLGRLLGEGGMGRVVDGFAADLGQYLAVKVLLGEHRGDPEMRARFDEEVAIMASIDHPGSLPIYGTGTDSEGNPCYVMKKVEGRTLTELLAERGGDFASVPSRRRLLGVLLDVCETVAYAHQAGVVHRDLKPDNILVDRHDSVYVIDWGIAKRVGAGGAASAATRTLPGRVMGSPGYMAPEQADGRAAAAGPQADVFALGVILYEILTGCRPFGDDAGRIEMLGTIHGDPEHPRRRNWLLRRSISEVCMKALGKDPARRYPDARGLAADIRAHLEGRPVSAVRPNLVERVRYASRKRPLRAAAIASLVVASLTLAVFIGAQVVADHRLSDKAMERLEVIDLELAELTGEAAELRRRVVDIPEESDERKRLEYELRLLDWRWVLGEMQALRLLSEVGGLRFIREDPELSLLARERMFSTIEGALERGGASAAAAMIDSVLERHAEGGLRVPLSAADLERLERLAVRADEQAGLPAP